MSLADGFTPRTYLVVSWCSHCVCFYACHKPGRVVMLSIYEGFAVCMLRWYGRSACSQGGEQGGDAAAKRGAVGAQTAAILSPLAGSIELLPLQASSMGQTHLIESG
jgi:hypothetical protein